MKDAVNSDPAWSLAGGSRKHGQTRNGQLVPVACEPGAGNSEMCLIHKVNSGKVVERFCS